MKREFQNQDVNVPADSEPLFCNSTLVFKTDSKSFEYNNSAFDTAGEEAIVKENRIGILCDLKDSESDSVPSASKTNDRDRFSNPPKLECSMVVDNFTEGDDIEAKNSVTPSSIPSSKLESFDKDAEFYTDKNVMECELPELIVCYKESFYHVVKDICIDEGVISHDKILIKSGKDECNSDDIFLPSDRNIKDNSTKRGVDTEMFIPDRLESSKKDCNKDDTNEFVTEEKVDIELTSQDKILDESSKDERKSGCIFIPSDGEEKFGITKQGVDIELLISDRWKSSEEDCKKDATNECGTKEKEDIELFIPDGLQSSSENHSDKYTAKEYGFKDLIETDEGIDNIVDDLLREECVGNSMLLVQEFNRQTSLKSLLESSHHGGNEVKRPSAQIPFVEGISESPAVVSAPEESKKSDPAKDLSYNSKVEKRTITFDFDSSKVVARSKVKKENVGCEHQPESQNVPKHVDGLTGSLSVVSQVQHCNGESSFSAAGPVSNRINSSGHIPYSGSISVRSDSSATSTRSFAFPVLQSEWNFSPVRMAKADPRRHRKHGGWRQGLLCCRF
ncbi:uncharacterized protein LOC132294758 isoform X2 [Cornus florida]|uniref:uncharacterized protein LOC132294758 isoform X2 n=1 Tax=Cornus florida TaxID=4283 RepID=UPI002899AF32|nr:uncharacterized protein LOC132294758 isoform X2 [Cornus florida]XP_059648715.1 uncharacterized protein LOC132294758 isoform X2 [Cornus florida]